MFGQTATARLLLDRGAQVDEATLGGMTPLMAACSNCHIGAARLLLERGADMNLADFVGLTPHDLARNHGHAALAAWLARIRTVGWTRHLSEPRYMLVVLRELAASARAQREHASHGKERVLDLLFPSDQPNKPDQPRLPDDVFSLVVRFYWCGETVVGAGPSAARRQGRPRPHPAPAAAPHPRALHERLLPLRQHRHRLGLIVCPRARTVLSHVCL